MKYLFLVLAIITFVACSTDQTTITDLQSEVSSLQDKITSLEANVDDLKEPNFMHTVYFWLKEDLSPKDKAIFDQKVAALGAIKSVSRYRMGGAEATEERGVVDNSYSLALNVEFTSIANHDAYQIDPIHLDFVESCKTFWDKVIVYDNKM